MGSAQQSAVIDAPAARPALLFHVRPRQAGKRKLWMALAWSTLLAALFSAHFVHLRADFPHQSRWRDWAKYTDEGWYGNAAIRHEIRQQSPDAFAPAEGKPSWYLAGDFNPAVALPVWQLLLAGVFHLTGLSLSAARALSVGVLGLDGCLLFLLLRRLGHGLWAGLAAVTVALSSMYWFVFDRLAILEPLASGFLLGAALLALEVRWQPRRNLFLGVLGMVCCLLLLTKTTGLFLLPGVLLLLRPEGSFRYGLRRWVRDAALASAWLAVFYGSYLLLVRHAGYAVDFRYLFSSNVYPHPVTVSGWLTDGWSTLHGVFYVGRILPWTAMAMTAILLVRERRLPRIAQALWLSIGCYLFFIFLHNNPQPRYYLPVALLLIVIGVAGAFELLGNRGRVARWGGVAALVVLGAAAVSGALEIGRYLRHPRYSLVDAAQALTAYIDAHPNGNRLLLSTSGDEISLITGLPALCDDYGPWELPDRIGYYRPGWFATWNELDYGTLVDIHTHDSLERAATFPAMDDADRNVLVLYKLHALPGKDVGVPEVEEEP